MLPLIVISQRVGGGFIMTRGEDCIAISEQIMDLDVTIVEEIAICDIGGVCDIAIGEGRQRFIVFSGKLCNM